MRVGFALTDAVFLLQMNTHMAAFLPLSSFVIILNFTLTWFTITSGQSPSLPVSSSSISRKSSQLRSVLSDPKNSQSLPVISPRKPTVPPLTLTPLPQISHSDPSPQGLSH